MATQHLFRLRLVMFCVLLGMGFSRSAMASHEVGTARLSSPNVTVSNVLFIEDNKYQSVATMPGTGTWGFYDLSFNNKLMLGIDRYYTGALADFVATVTVQVTSVSPLALGGGSSVVTRTLSVSYEGKNDHQSSSPHASVDLDVYSFNNGYMVTTQILGISVTSSDPLLTGTTLPANVYLEAQTDAERYYDLPQNFSPFFNNDDVVIHYLDATDEFEISWSHINGAEAYDLEWLWLDGEKNAYWTANPEIDFRHNSTRVRTSQQSYRISNIFEKGQVFFRLRGVGKASLLPNAWEKTAYTPWSWQDQTPIVPSSIANTNTVVTMAAPSNGTDRLFYLTLDGVTQINGNPVVPKYHESNKNWQYKATYAEEGKKKEVISYFDGTLRSRQSVTKNNSDNNAIVGETYYDYNGRAAVQALPVPVPDATIKFYQYNVAGRMGFNFEDNSEEPYGKQFFDEEASVGTSTTCAVLLAGINPKRGTSHYYSDYNLNQQFAQGYVPNAEKFPISQTVYTNDNTGRIAAQGGVGKTHQIGTGHETKYFYGVAEQVELDRLFGSEVGYKQHYKKNMVVDANGQVSLSYLDQEGRTVATALTGPAPANMSNLKDAGGNVLYPAPTASTVLDADLLNKVNASDYDTETDNNQRAGDKLTFSQKILVPTAGTYTLSYTLEGTSFTYSCLPTNACYDCVYDLEIDVFDNCMNNPPGFTKVTQTLGNIVPPAGPGSPPASGYTLDTQCNQIVNFSTTQLNSSGNHLLIDLGQGEYTVTKTLKINQAALSFYLNDYLKSDCVKQPEDFDHIQPDTSGCGLTCDQCVAALGSVQSYTAAGKGSAADWQREYDVCREPCAYVSLCEAEYLTMLADVSPGGQYGDWEDNTGACNPALYPLSVYNPNNQLPKIKNFAIGYTPPGWRSPFLRKSIYQSGASSDFEAEYRDDDGSISKVYVTKVVSGTTVSYHPALRSGVTPTPVDPNNTGAGAQYYVKPYELDQLADFIANWRNSWAKSLVFYHPEYAYYDWCLKNSTDTLTNRYAVTVGTGTNAVTGYVTNSDSYDSLLLVTDDILTTSSSEFLKLCNPLSYDPYWAKNGKYYDQFSFSSATMNSGYPVAATGSVVPQQTGTPTTSLSWPWRNDYKPIDIRYNNYSNSVSVPALAALITTSCAIQYGQAASSQLGCLASLLNVTASTTTNTAISVNNVGVDVIMSQMPMNLRNDYWNRFKSIYLALKNEMQTEAAESYAMNGEYRGVNDGIGNPGFDAQDLSTPFTQYYAFNPGTPFANIFKQWFFPMNAANEPQYCTPFTNSLYAGKIKRFPSAKNATALGNQLVNGDPGAKIYASTGLCPNAFYFQNLLNALAFDGRLTASSINLSTVPEFNKDLYTEVAGGSIPSSASFVQANWTGSSSTHALTASMQVGALSPCGLTLNFPTGYPFNFSNTGNSSTYTFLKLYQMVPGASSPGTYNFTIKADVALASGSSQTFTTVVLSGSTCIPLTGCSFTPPCEPSLTAIALQKLMNAIAATGNQCSASGVLMSGTSIQPYFVNSFGQLLGTGNWKWLPNVAAPNFVIKDANGLNSNSLTVTLSTGPCTANTYYTFSNISGSNLGSNVFNVVVTSVTGSGSSVSTTTAAATGTVYANGQPLVMGKCSFDLDKCSSVQHKVREDMETFLANANTPTRLKSASFNYTPVFNFGLRMRDQLAGSYQTFNATTQATNPLYYYWKQSAASTSTLLTGHFMASTLTSVPAPDASACGFSLSVVTPSAMPGGQSLLSSSYTLSNFILAPGPMVNLATYDFSVTATFGSTPLILKGTSACFGMRACDECVSVQTTTSSQTLMVNAFNCTGNPGYSLSHGLGGPHNYYNQTLPSCQSPVFQYSDNYAIASSVNYNVGGNTLQANGYNGGTSLFISYPGRNELSLQQPYSFQAGCGRFDVSVKILNQMGPFGSFDQPYPSGTPKLRVNGTTLSLVSVLPTADPSWSEYIFSSATNVVGAVNHIELYNFAGVTGLVGIDEIKVMSEDCIVSIPCTTIDTILPFPEVEYEDPCIQYALDAAENEGDELYNAYVDSVKTAFTQAYIDKCIGRTVENMRLQYNAGDYHFTLYYYDQAGNLVRTVPPEGVHVETNPANLATIISERANPLAPKTYFTSHTLVTTYSYNSLNQLVAQETPDAGVSHFWYDVLGRLVASQNAKQASLSSSGAYVYSYTRYDELGRISEVGEATFGNDFRAMSSAAVATLVSSGHYPDHLVIVGSRKREVTSTYYGDDPAFTPLVSGSSFSSGSQEYLRSRVAAVSIEETDDGSAATYNHATHYSYDVHGNVKELIQENKDLNLFSRSQQLKKLSYQYDLISGKVNEVAYQDGLADMFKHRYEYDADNRITAVYTSKNNVIWERDAKYFYYLHGPLARVETGHDKVQGTDYAYTLHGWIKGVNSNSLREDLDIGQDGLKLASPSHANTYNAKDVFGYSLTYYEDRNINLSDYRAINNVSGTGNDFIADVYAGGLPQTPDLFNGNIRRMASSYLDGSAPGKSYAVKALLRDFTYDQLNRIESATANDNLKPDGNEWGMAGSLLYQEQFTYDQNGNILKAQRNGDNSGSLAMDDLSYHYVSGTNKLDYVDDAISGDPYSVDISSQSPGNYAYDQIGNLVKDDAEGISHIEWTVYGKIKKIDFASARRELIFKYDASGNRVSKTVHDFVGDNVYTTTYYVRDAQGNVMATYNEMWNTDTDAKSLGLSEQHIYGSSRLGMVKSDLDLTVYENTPLNTSSTQRALNFRSYELSNHLGNVMAVVSDRKIAAETTGDNLTDYFTGEVLSANDYYVYHMTMPGRSFNSNSYRYGGSNGQEKDNDIFEGAYTAEYWEYDARIGRRWNVDPITKQNEASYVVFANNPIFVVDIHGDTGEPVKGKDGNYSLNTTIYLKKGDNVTDKQFAEIKAAFENVNATFKGTYQGNNVTANVKVVVVDSKPTDFKPGENFFEVTTTGESHVDPNNTTGIISILTLNETTVAHEWGHLFGLVDRYAASYLFNSNHEIDFRVENRTVCPLILDLSYDKEYNPYTNLYSSATGGSAITQYQYSVMFGDNTENTYTQVILFKDDVKGVLYDAVKVSEDGNKVEGFRNVPDNKTKGKSVFPVLWAQPDGRTSKGAPLNCGERSHEIRNKKSMKEFFKSSP